ncbi:MAG TPA: alpha/beta fold hydrolase [Acidimicrobiales bacterium]
MRITANGIGIEVDEGGDGPPVLLLHGWPDTRRLWRDVAPALRGAGYRTIAPDLRGFGDSDKPEPVAAYGLLDLAGDALGVLDALGAERAHVVGHDWGAALAWALAAFAPDRVASLAALSVGHPIAFREAGFAQREKSWYMLLFQFEGVAERWLGGDDFANLAAWSRHPDLDDVRRRLADPEALTASLRVYRANVAPEALVAPPAEIPPARCPTLGVWSAGDMALTEQQMVSSAAHVTGRWRYERVEEVGHWIPLEAPEALAAMLVDHLADARAAAATG